MLSRNNLYLRYLFLTILGIICFLTNVKELIDCSGLLLISIVLMITPATINIFGWDSDKLSRIQSLSLVGIPLIFLNYIYYIKMGLPVGFEDVHNHIFQYTQLFSENGNILFSNAQRISYNFVGLYVVFHFLTQICHIDVVVLASLLPPLFNLAVIFLVYIIVNRLHSHKVALIAMMLFGWENQVLIFGHEMRTQTISTVLIFSIISLLLIFQNRTDKKSLCATIALLVLISGTATTSFVSIFFASLLLFTILVSQTILSTILKWPKKTLVLTWKLFGIFIILVSFYLLFIGKGFQMILLYIVQMFTKLITKITIANVETSSPNVGQVIYGDFIQITTYAFWLLFILFSVLYIIKIVKQKEIITASFFISFGVLLVFGFICSITGPLSVGRVYTVAFILIATVISFGFFEMQNYMKKTKFRYLTKIFVYAVIVLFISSSVAKIPNYVIGDTMPIRSEEPIDFVPYWNSDLPQYAVNTFLASDVNTGQSIDSCLLIRNYEFLRISNVNGFTITKRLNTAENKIKPGELLVLHDKFNGQSYTHRDILPRYEDYKQYNKIYTNVDYLIVHGGVL